MSLNKDKPAIIRIYNRYPESVLMPLVLAGILIFILTWAGVRFLSKVLTVNIRLPEKREVYFHIPTGATLEQVRDSLAGRYLVSEKNFLWLARRKNYHRNILPGRYRLTDGMRNNELVNMLKSGRQTPVRIAIHNVRTPAELAARLAKRIESDSAALMATFSDRTHLARFGLTPATLFVLFIPNTYELYWNTSGPALLERMHRESEKFWTTARRGLADASGLTVAEVITLASIVEKESNKDDEKAVIAGVYLNRLRKGMPLQADPTVIYAWQDFSIRRVLKKHTDLKSPYNTYQINGLPPGPICLPSIASIEAVLKPQHHSYLYFCAKEDLSGYHRFASSMDEHLRNARKYQNALNMRNIR